MHALTAFAKALPTDTDRMEVDICEDGSGCITAITGDRRTITLTFNLGHPDGTVYDRRRINTPGYVVYEPSGQGE